MFAEHSGPGAVLGVLALALGPALLRWWWGRALAAQPDHPLIAERLQAHHVRVGYVIGACLMALCAGWPRWSLWTIPLLFFTQSAASYPLTRTLYDETWSLAAFVSFYTRLPVAIFGFWALLAAAPWIVSMAGAWEWAATATLAVVLVAWDRYFADVLRALLRTEPITDPVLLDRFAALVAASGLPAPRFEWVRMGGGVLANALALGSLRQSSVIFTDTLVSRLSVDETVAICAHEIAHLEYYNRARLRRIQVGNWFLIAVVCAVTPVSRWLFGPEQFLIPAAACSGAVAVALVLRSRHLQRNETASDVRAVALTGDPDALARALTTLHGIAKIPRRWGQQVEQQATHPSLARRIRDIHAAAGTAAGGTIASTATFHAARGDAAVTFDAAHLHWQETPGATHRLEYGTLSELRLKVQPSGDASLVAVERQGRRWTMPARPEDAAALQAMLDAVDGRLGEHAAVPVVSSPVTRFAAVFACTLAATLGHAALALVALVAAFAPAHGVLIATGAAAFVTAALVLARDTGYDGPALATILGLVGAGFLAMAHARRADGIRPPPLGIAVLAVGALLATAAVALGGLEAVRLHQGARDITAAPVLLVALAAVCWSWRDRPRFRYAALAAALTGIAIVAVGSRVFLERAGRDPFLVEAAPLEWTGLDAVPIASFEVPFEIDALRLSPHGRMAAFVREHDENDRTAAVTPAFHLRNTEGSLGTLDASDLVFIDERRVLLLTVGEAGAAIRVASFDGAPALNWSERVAELRSASLSYHAAHNRWVLVGRAEDGAIVRATGTVGRPGVERTTWKGLPERDGWISAIGTRGTTALAFQKHYGYGILGAAIALRLPSALLHMYPESRLWRLGPDARVEAGRSLLDVMCVDEASPDEALLCTAFDGARTRILTVDPATAAVTPLAMVEGPFYADRLAAPGWLSGWWRGRALAVHLGTRRAVRLRNPAGEYLEVVAPAESVIAAATSVADGTRVRIYPLSAPAGVMTRAR